MMVAKRNLLFQGVIFRFHVKLWDGKVQISEVQYQSTIFFQFAPWVDCFVFFFGGSPAEKKTHS